MEASSCQLLADGSVDDVVSVVSAGTSKKKEEKTRKKKMERKKCTKTKTGSLHRISLTVGQFPLDAIYCDKKKEMDVAGWRSEGWRRAGGAGVGCIKGGRGHRSQGGGRGEVYHMDRGGGGANMEQVNGVHIGRS